MSEAVPNTQNEFWRPPAVLPQSTEAEATSPTSVESCPGCTTEFMVGAKFCHVCGSARPDVVDAARSWTSYLVFQTIAHGFAVVRQRIGLPLPSLIALFVGMACLLATVCVGLIYPEQSYADFQAVQFYRVQWLLAAVAAFVAGILLKKSGSSSQK